MDAPHSNHTAEEHGHGEYRRRNHRVPGAPGPGRPGPNWQNRFRGQGENDGVLRCTMATNHVR